MKIIQTPDPIRTRTLAQPELRESFLLDGLFVPGTMQLKYGIAEDRAGVVGVVPLKTPLILNDGGAFKSDFFLERREIGILNLGGKGWIKVEDQVFNLGHKDALYVGKGKKSVEFGSEDSLHPAHFYGVSYPAHQSYPTTCAKAGSYQSVDLGAKATANCRTLYKIIHQEGIQSCQLVMGYTDLLEGSVWNTMPPHTHSRRSEVYLYFGLQNQDRVFHFMGEPSHSKHLVVNNLQGAWSPPWSMHFGVGTSSYSFCWAMGGENQLFQDMDQVSLDDLK